MDVASLKPLELALQRIDAQIMLANLKASFILPANVVLIGFLINQRDAYLSLLSDSVVCWLPILTFNGVLLCTALSLLCAGSVIWSVLKTGNEKDGYQTLLFAGGIKLLKLEGYQNRVCEMQASPEIFKEDLTRQIHLLSGALLKKFRRTNWALGWLGIAVLQVLLMLSLSSFLWF